MSAMDAPLFALAKYVRWKWLETNGEDKIVVMFGGLHIAMALWRAVGDYLDCSGWTNALTQAGTASSGTAESFLSCSRVTRTRHAHQVNAVVSRKLQKEVILTLQLEAEESEEAWLQEMVRKSPTIQYWDTILILELLAGH